VQTLHFSLCKEPGLKGDTSGLIKKLDKEKVKWHTSTVVHSAVNAIVPPFNIIVCSHRDHEYAPISYSERWISNPLPPHVCHKIVQLVRLHTSVQMMEHSLNMFRWKKWQCHHLTYKRVNVAAFVVSSLKLNNSALGKKMI
jgi:hypothetical protein